MSNETISGIVITVLLAIIVIIGMGNFIGGMTKEYNVTVNTSFISKSQQYSEQLRNASNNLEQTVKGFEWWNPLGYVQGGASIVNIIFTSVGVVKDFFISLADMFSLGGIIPSWLTGIVLVIIIVIAVFELVSAYFKYKM